MARNIFRNLSNWIASPSAEKVEKIDAQSGHSLNGFYKGQKVSVIAGTLDPDYGGSIGGWSGIVEEVILDDDPTEVSLYCIKWDRNTLKAMGRIYQNRSENDNFDFERMVLAQNELKAG